MQYSLNKRIIQMVNVSLNVSFNIFSSEKNNTALRNHMRIFFWGDVVLDTFNNVSRDEDNILDQIYVKQIFSDFYYEDLKF